MAAALPLLVEVGALLAAMGSLAVDKAVASLAAAAAADSAGGPLAEAGEDAVGGALVVVAVLQIDEVGAGVAAVLGVGDHRAGALDDALAA